MSNDAFEFKDLGLSELTELLEGKVELPVAKVGILGSETQRLDDEGEITNAQIGFYHEFGIGEKQRSFLRMPLAMNLNRELNKAGAFDEEVIERLLLNKEGLEFITKVAIVAEGIVLDSFYTGGFGAWKPSNMQHKEVHQTLVETGQLRDSITYEVEK